MDAEMIPDQALADFADHLVPEAFERFTAAGRVRLEEPRSGPDGFDDWIEQRLAEALDWRWPRGDAPLVVAFLSDGRLRWCFDDGGCGPLEAVRALVGIEAATIARPWLLAAVLPRPTGHGEVATDEDGSGSGEVWRASSETRWRAGWYAEARGRGVAATRAGLVDLVGERPTARHEIEVTATEATRQLHRTLYRHPARRRHPLRRSRRR